MFTVHALRFFNDIHISYFILGKVNKESEKGEGKQLIARYGLKSK